MTVSLMIKGKAQRLFSRRDVVAAAVAAAAVAIVLTRPR